jgi:hypothetical protein
MLVMMLNKATSVWLVERRKIPIHTGSRSLAYDKATSDDGPVSELWAELLTSDVEQQRQQHQTNLALVGCADVGCADDRGANQASRSPGGVSLLDYGLAARTGST